MSTSKLHFQIDLDLFRKNLTSECETALSRARSQSPDLALSELDGIFKGVFALVRSAGTGRPWQSPLVEIARELVDEYTSSDHFEESQKETRAV